MTPVEVDSQIAAARAVFEQSLIDHAAPADLAEELRAYADAFWHTWRARRLWEAQAQAYLETWRGGTVQ
jgi:hypothetical protein